MKSKVYEMFRYFYFEGIIAQKNKQMKHWNETS